MLLIGSPFNVNYRIQSLDLQQLAELEALEHAWCSWHR